MLIFIAVMGAITVAGVVAAFIVAARRSREARAQAVDPGAGVLYRGPILLNSDGGFD